MKWSDVPVGNYEAKIADWGLEEVEKLNNQLRAVIMFDVACGLGGTDLARGRWEGLIETKDGKPNQKTIKTLVTCGFASDDILDLVRTDALDKESVFEVTVSKEAFGDKVYTRIDWVNRPGAGGGIKKARPTKRLPASFAAALASARSELGVTPPVKNYAPGAADETLPF